MTQPISLLAHATYNRLRNLIDAAERCPQFASVLYTSKPSGARLTPETARHTILLGASMQSLYEADLAQLKALTPTYTDGDSREACLELMAARRKSLDAWAKGESNPDATSADAYTDTGCPGLKVHLASGDLHLTGLSIAKVVIREPATYRTVKSRTLVSAAKKMIEPLLPSARLRQFNLGNARAMKLQGETLEFDHA